jgi:predicted RNase H-like nuclease (RuvC/YqgF family)
LACASRDIFPPQKLRAELSVLVAQRDEATSHAEQQQHTVTLLQEQIQDFKVKLSRMTQQKIQLERDCLRQAQSSTLTTASSAAHRSTALDSDYYPRKVQELQGRVQSLQAVVAEKNRQIEELSQQLERQWNPSCQWSATAGRRSTAG